MYCLKVTVKEEPIPDPCTDKQSRVKPSLNLSSQPLTRQVERKIHYHPGVVRRTVEMDIRTPNLYDLTLELLNSKGKVIDRVRTTWVQGDRNLVTFLSEWRSGKDQRNHLHMQHPSQVIPWMKQPSAKTLSS